MRAKGRFLFAFLVYFLCEWSVLISLFAFVPAVLLLF